MKFQPFVQERFENRHLGSRGQDVQKMLQTIGVNSVDELMEQTIPSGIRLQKTPELRDLPDALTESALLEHLKTLGSKNKLYRSYLGQGYYRTQTPGVILRNILENPGWYTAYTPYQAEIAQGRLEMLLNYQTAIAELNGLDIANASLLDEGTAAAEAMNLFWNSRKGPKKKTGNTFLVDANTFTQTLEIIKTRAKPLGIQVQVADLKSYDFSQSEAVFGALIQNPGDDGQLRDWTSEIQAAKGAGIFIVMATDLMASAVSKSAGEMGADVAVGNSQRFGVPMGFGGPHAGYFACKESFKRQVPGRIIGRSVDRNGKTALRMALQTREQHIRREKATSNICTAQVLLAVIAGAYAVYHGPQGIRGIAEGIHAKASLFASLLKDAGFTLRHTSFFDTLTIQFKDNTQRDHFFHEANQRKMNLRLVGSDALGVAFDECVTPTEFSELLSAFNLNQEGIFDLAEIPASIAPELERPLDYLQHPTFSKYHTEHEMLRYLKRLENRDLSLTHSMISLGSCTMKLNATSEMIPVTWPEFSIIHPFAPKDQWEGYRDLIEHLGDWLATLTGFDAVSLQPNSGAQGEYAGLLAIHAYHESRGDTHRNISLIPASAHGTNPASAALAGMKVVVVACDEHGNIDVQDLIAKADQHADNLSCLMVTYPSTHGVFEETIVEVCQIIHERGGQVYMDGANLNAQVGFTSPGFIGADVCHLNLHKTFAIPHGGGGPGMGPIGVAKHLTPFLPKHPVLDKDFKGDLYTVSSAPFGSASILPISYAYIAMLGMEGIRNSTRTAILNANYLMNRLQAHYPILYTGSNDRCAHEFIMDCREFKASAGISNEDIAKRLMDYGYHAPTVSFPVAGTLMIEPTESESLEELDRFADTLIQIREEIREVEAGTYPQDNNPVVNAPHPAEIVMSEAWDFAYTREKAAYPLEWVKERKFWPFVSRIDNAYGDRNLACSCAPIEDYQ